MALTSFVGAKWRWATLGGAALARFQDDRARRMVEFAARHSPFYRAHWAGHDLRDWRALPTVDKSLMMAHFDRFNTRGVELVVAMRMALAAEGDTATEEAEAGLKFLRHGELTAGLSSGTSGERGLFLVSQAERLGWAGTILARALHGWPRLPLRVALFLRANSPLYTTLRSRLVDFRYFDLRLPVAEATERLNQFQPQVLVGPPSLLERLAVAVEQGALRSRPKRLIAVAEVLEAQDEAWLTYVFNAPVHQIYQCTEGLLAISCRHGRLHVQEDLVAVQLETVDVSGVRCQVSQPSEYKSDRSGFRATPDTRRQTPDTDRVTPIVTDLWRTTQPIIRYRLGDLLRLDARSCPCGSEFRVIEAIEGRVSDALLFETGDGGWRRVFPDEIRRAILEAHPAVREYEAVQADMGQVAVYIEVAAGMDARLVVAAVREKLGWVLARLDCRVERLTVEPGVPERLPHVKRRRVRRLR